MKNIFYNKIMQMIKKKNKYNIPYVLCEPLIKDYSDLAFIGDKIKKFKTLHFIIPVDGKNALFGVFYHENSDSDDCFLMFRADTETEKFKSVLLDEEKLLEFIWSLKNRIKKNYYLFDVKRVNL